MNWDDLRVVMAVHKGGSYAAASADLKVDETTVARRIARLQDDLGFPLFEATEGGRQPTAQCKEILAHVDQIAKHVAEISDIKRAGKGLVGRCRIAATDSVSAEILAPNAPRFLADNPGLTLQLLTSTESVNFSRWEADVAVRLHKPEKGDFVISKLADMSLLYLEPVTGNESLLCAYPEDLDLTPESRHLSAAGLQARARCLTKNLLVVKALLRSGACSAVLPAYMAAEFLDDARFKATNLEETRGAWLLVQSHLKGDPATRLVIDWIRDCFADLSRKSTQS